MGSFTPVCHTVCGNSPQGSFEYDPYSYSLEQKCSLPNAEHKGKDSIPISQLDSVRLPFMQVSFKEFTVFICVFCAPHAEEVK